MVENRAWKVWIGYEEAITPYRGMVTVYRVRSLVLNFTAARTSLIVLMVLHFGSASNFLLLSDTSTNLWWSVELKATLNSLFLTSSKQALYLWQSVAC